ncbi:MAG: S46 family peptidase [Flavobacteriales bacterium]
MTLRITLLTVTFLSFFSVNSSATEGMWIPTLLEAVEDDMQAMGLELSAEDIYSINQSSLKDAIVHFNGGCTAELISSQGLLLTNHHCGYSQIQSHSSLENNYLRDGFWAKSFSDELPNESLTATLIDRITDVTDEMFEGITADMSDEQVQMKLQENAKRIEDGAKTDLLDGSVRAYNYGNSYFLITTITYKDVRLVGTPPDAVGKFGGDTDNWVWPRHTGDFSMFRIYADADNNPAAYSTDNKPYEPRQHLKVSLNGIEEGDFTMVFGFPGRTEQYLISDAVQYVMETANPMRIQMRDESLAIIDAAMRADEKTKIQYASKQSSISNAWKKWKGQNRGLKKMDALNRKKALEEAYQLKADAHSDQRFKTIISEISTIYQKNLTLEKAKDLYVEYYYYGPEIVDFSNKLVSFSEAYLSSESPEEQKALQERYSKMINNYFDDYDVNVDKAIFKALTPLYSDYLDDNYEPVVLAQGRGDWNGFTEKVFKNKVVTDREAALNFVSGMSKGKAKKFKKSLAAKIGSQVDGVFRGKALPDYRMNSATTNTKMKTFVEGLMLFFPDKDYWADANSTLRLTYGKAEGSEPVDGTMYKYYTTADGILAKHAKGVKDYELPEDLVKLLEKEEYGVYAHTDGELRVCFTGSNHTTGGNSGSPALDSKGHLVGLNFDRSWESTMSDIMFDPEQCRNIMVDIRYVLFIIDKYAGATRLIDEMDLVKGKPEKPETEKVLMEIIE